MRQIVGCLAVLTTSLLFGCTTEIGAEAGADPEWLEPSEQQLALYYDAYELFLAKAFPLDSSGYLSVQLYKDMPSDEPEDLELSFSLIRAIPSGELQIRVLAADRIAVVHQIYQLATSSTFESSVALLGKIQLVQRHLDLASCPAVASIQDTWRAEWLANPLPGVSDQELIRLHPMVVRIAVRRGDRTVTLETTDPSDSAFRWGVDAVSQVRGCLLGSPAA